MPPPTHHRDVSHTDTSESLSALLIQLYTLHLLLPSHSTSSSLSIFQPPHSPSPSLLSTWQKVGMSDVVIQTLLQLPYLCGKEGDKEIAPDTLALDYLDENGDAVEVWKDPFCLLETGGASGKISQGYLGNAIPLTSCIGFNGCLLLLDLDSNHIYEIKSKDPQISPPNKPSPGAAPQPYHHYPHKPALQALQQYIINAKKLHWIHDPDTNTWLQPPSDNDWENSGKYKALKQLYTDCGWPERFEREEFMARLTLMGRSRGWDD